MIGVHTAESGTDRSGPDPKAENVANFIRTRSTAGSYALLGDADSIIQLVDFADESFSDSTGSNRWAIHISLAMNAGDWPGLPDDRRDQLVDTAAQMAAMAAKWIVSQGLAAPSATHLTRAQSNSLSASGFIAHGRRDPTRRSDPGAGFPWEQFFAAYAKRMNMDDPKSYLEVLQAELGVPVDDVFGPATEAALLDQRGVGPLPVSIIESWEEAARAFANFDAAFRDAAEGK